MELITRKNITKYEFQICDQSSMKDEIDMVHSESPLGLLPKFSSWSLVSIGKFSDYNCHTGLSQPGFMTNHNYLIPWEIHIGNGQVTSLCDKPRKNQDKSSKSSDSVKDSDLLLLENKNNSNTLTIRAFIGMEYECPLGHRFICSGPDRLVKVSTNGVVKVNKNQFYFI